MRVIYMKDLATVVLAVKLIVLIEQGLVDMPEFVKHLGQLWVSVKPPVSSPIAHNETC